MEAVRLRADGMTLSEIHEETHTPTDTLKGWFRRPEVQGALQQVVADRHQEAETIRTMTGQKGVLLLGKAIRMLDKRIDELTRQVAVDPENVAKLARAATAAAKTAMDHGGFPKTERVEATITGEVKVEADVCLMAKPEATLEAEAAALVEAMRADEKLFRLLGKATG
jgi:cell division septum initiation protein DivIVA